MGMLTRQPELLSQVSGADLESIKNGVVPVELTQRIGQAASNVVQEKDEFQFIPATENQPGGTFKKTTGEFIPSETGSTPENDENTKVLQDKVGLIDELLVSPGLSGSVGAYGLTRWTPLTIDKADRQAFAAGVNQLVGKETIDTLIALKARGGTLGALSDQERALLQNSATKIGSWILKDKNGNPTGKFGIDEVTFKKELEQIKEVANRAIRRAKGEEEEKYVADPVIASKLEQNLREKIKVNAKGEALNDEDYKKLSEGAAIMFAAGRSQDEITKAINVATGFEQEVSMSTDPLASLKSSIIAQESGGNYLAIGASTPHGKALGKYQIIPKFHFAKIGLKDIPEDHKKFLESPYLQDQLFGKLIEELALRYNNDPVKIAAAYYGGDAATKIVGTKKADKSQTAGGKKFPSINEYVNSVLSRVV